MNKEEALESIFVFIDDEFVDRLRKSKRSSRTDSEELELFRGFASSLMGRLNKRNAAFFKKRLVHTAEILLKASKLVERAPQKPASRPPVVGLATSARDSSGRTVHVGDKVLVPAEGGRGLSGRQIAEIHVTGKTTRDLVVYRGRNSTLTDIYPAAKCIKCP